MKKQIAVILGTRPEAIKLIPVYLALKDSISLAPILISTGQHKEMLDMVFNFFGVRPDYELNVMTANQSLASLTSKLFHQLSDWCSTQNIAAIMVQGDTTTAMVAGMIGFYNKKKVIHVEAGLRTYNKESPFPEEINRRIIGLIADINFAPTSKAEKILKSENASNVYNVGNTVIDSLISSKIKIESNEKKYFDTFSYLFNSKSKRIILVTGHRRENIGQGLINICEALKYLAVKYKEVNFVYPVHLNPNVKEVVFRDLGNLQNIFLTDPLAYDELVYLMNKSFMILTDSGGIQEEAPSLAVPVVVMRDNTERPEGVEAGCAVLAGTGKESIVYNFEAIYNDPVLHQKMSNSLNPYGDGKSAMRIKQILETSFR